MGDAGLALKVSADGAAWTEALRADPATGRVQLPQGGQVAPGSAGTPGLGLLGDADTGLFRPRPDQLGFAAGGVPRAVLSAAGLQLDVPLTGTAVSESALDTTAGRLARVGYAGLWLTGNGIGAPCNDANLCLSTAFNYRFSTSGLNCPISNPYQAAEVVREAERFPFCVDDGVQRRVGRRNRHACLRPRLLVMRPAAGAVGRGCWRPSSG